MKVVRYDGWRVGVTDGRRLADASDLCAAAAEDWPPVAVHRLIRRFAQLRPQLQARLAAAPETSLSKVRLEAPLAWPNKLLAYPANYHDHIHEMATTSRANVNGFFLKANSSLSGPRDAIVVPDLPGREVHHECEIGIVIGREGRRIARADALRHVFGYTCLVDVTIRGKEERVMRKSYDTFTPIGPWIVTADEIPDPADIRMRLWVNGELRQQASSRDMILDISEMIAMASSAATLYPGDLIASGTPAGVGPIHPGDTVEMEVEGVGRLTLPVVAGGDAGSAVFDAPYQLQKAPA